MGVGGIVKGVGGGRNSSTHEGRGYGVARCHIGEGVGIGSGRDRRTIDGNGGYLVTARWSDGEGLVQS